MGSVVYMGALGFISYGGKGQRDPVGVEKDVEKGAGGIW